MSGLFRGAVIVWTALRFGLDELVLASFEKPWIRLLTRIVSTGRNLKAPRGERLREALNPAPAMEPLFSLLADTSVAAANELPNTGVAPERERMLSAARIVSDTYGTRCSTVVMQKSDGTVRFAERTYGPQGAELDTVGFEFRTIG